MREIGKHKSRIVLYCKTKYFPLDLIRKIIREAQEIEMRTNMDYQRKDPLDYKDIAENLRHPAWYDIEDDSILLDDAATAITDLLARAEAAERERDSLREVLDMYGGEYGITAMLRQKEAAESRVHELETTHRVEMCEDGYDCVELGKVRNKLEAAETRAEKAEEIASDLCDDFTDFVTGGVHNAAPYCANMRPECVNAHGWCNGDNSVCRGFLPKAAGVKEE